MTGCLLPFTDRTTGSTERADSYLRSYAKLLQKFTARKAIEIPFSDLLVSLNGIEIKNSVALVRERTILTERPPPVGEVSAKFCG